MQTQSVPLGAPPPGQPGGSLAQQPHAPGTFVATAPIVPQQLGPSGAILGGHHSKNYTLIETQEGVENLCRQILTCYPPPVLGLDCEGLIKGKPIALIQLSFKEHSYVFDVMRVNPFNHRLSCNLKQILTSCHIIKIFHDFCEDCSALINQHGIYCNSVFDTQIAHRVISTATQNLGNGSNENQIGLNLLLQKYLGADVQNTNKIDIAKKMKLDETIWHTERPLSEQMLEYAAQDVIFLPRVYEQMQPFFFVPWVERHCNARGEMTFENTTVQAKIFTDTMKCLQYATINNDIKDITDCEPGREIIAFIKNYRKDVIFCSLNLGVSGVIRDPHSRNSLEKFNSFGDLVYVSLHGFERHKGQAQLSFSRQFLRSNECQPYTQYAQQAQPQPTQPVFGAISQIAPFVPQQTQPHGPVVPMMQHPPIPVVHHSHPQYTAAPVNMFPQSQPQVQPTYQVQQPNRASQYANLTVYPIAAQQSATMMYQQQSQQALSGNITAVTVSQMPLHQPIDRKASDASAEAKICTPFSKSLTISEPEAEQSFNETSDDSYQSMNLMATAFVPTPKAAGSNRPATSKNAGSAASSQSQTHFFAPKQKANWVPATSGSGSGAIQPMPSATNYHSVGASLSGSSLAQPLKSVQSTKLLNRGEHHRTAQTDELTKSGGKTGYASNRDGVKYNKCGSQKRKNKRVSQKKDGQGHVKRQSISGTAPFDMDLLGGHTLKQTSVKATAGQQQRKMEFAAFLADDSYAGKKP